MNGRTASLDAPGWRTWTVWGVGVVAYVVAIVNRTSLSSVGIDAAVRFDADASALSMFAVIQLAVYGAMQIPVGVLLDRFGARPVIAAGMVLMAIGQLVMAFADTVGIGILARVLIGAGDAAVFPSVLRVIATWFPAQRAPVLIQLTGITGQLGQIVAVIPLAALLHATSWTVAFGSLAGLGVLFAVLTFAVIRNRPPAAPRRSGGHLRRHRHGRDPGRAVIGRPPRGVPRVVGAPRHAPGLLVALHDAVRRHRVRAAVGLPVPDGRAGADPRRRRARDDLARAVRHRRGSRARRAVEPASDPALAMARAADGGRSRPRCGSS